MDQQTCGRPAPIEEITLDNVKKRMGGKRQASRSVPESGGINSEDVARIVEGKMEELQKSIDQRMQDLVKGIVDKLDEKVSKQIQASMENSPSNVPESAVRVSPASRGIFPTIASVSNKKDKEKLASLVER